MKIFHELGNQLEAAWQQQNYDERSFPALAAAALKQANLHRAIHYEDVTDWVLSGSALPPQHDLDAKFGQPPLTVYSGRRCDIQVILWLNGSTTIHRHGFSGAFQVLHGSSLHTRYAFFARRQVTSRMLLGDLSLRGAELLHRGNVVEITNDLIHMHLYLKAPSATIVVRSFREDLAGPQYDYLPPGLALDPFSKDPAQVRQLQCLRFLDRSGHRRYADLAEELIVRSDLHTAYLVLHMDRTLASPRPQRDRLLAAARRRHGAAAEELALVLQEQLRCLHLERLASRVTDPDLGFFLTLLRNLPDRESIYALTRLRHPGEDPRQQVLKWLKALSGVDSIGVDVEDALNFTLLDALLDGCDQRALMERVAQVFEPDGIESQREALLRYCERLRRTPLSPLFQCRA
jgi:hypothetical protein